MIPNAMSIIMVNIKSTKKMFTNMSGTIKKKTNAIKSTTHSVKRNVFISFFDFECIGYSLNENHQTSIFIVK